MVEAEFTKAFIQFEREYLGRGPQDVRTIFLNDMVLVVDANLDEKYPAIKRKR